MKWESDKSTTTPPRRSVSEWWTSRDAWGMCCPTCPWRGQSHKPCAACQAELDKRTK